MFFFICGLFIFNAYCFRNGFIYIFFSYSHVFLVSGLCLKYDDKHKLRVDKVIYFLLIGFAMKAAIYFMEKIAGGEPKWHWFSDNNVPWYLFVTAGLFGFSILSEKSTA